MERPTKKVMVGLTNIINTILRLKFFQNKWGKLHICVIPKAVKDGTFPKSRPISLLPAISKVAKRIIDRRIAEYTEELSIIPDEQFGIEFRRGHST